MTYTEPVADIWELPESRRVDATNTLEALIEEVSSIVKRGVLTEDEGDLLIVKAREISIREESLLDRRSGVDRI